MDRVYLHWNLVNWITVFLMAWSGLMVMGMAGSAIRAYRKNGTLS